MRTDLFLLLLVFHVALIQYSSCCVKLESRHYIITRIVILARHHTSASILTPYQVQLCIFILPNLPVFTHRYIPVDTSEMWMFLSQETVASQRSSFVRLAPDTMLIWPLNPKLVNYRIITRRLYDARSEKWVFSKCNYIAIDVATLKGSKHWCVLSNSGQITMQS